MKNCYTRFIPHAPVEVAPRHSSKYWEADLNARIYERRLAMSGEENPYANWNRRQAWMNLIAKDMPPTNDPYLKPVAGPGDTFACKMKTSPKPPAVTSF